MFAFAVREKDDLAKLAFMNAACEEACPFSRHGLIPAEVGSCLDWRAARSAAQVGARVLRVCCAVICVVYAEKVNEARRNITRTIELLAEKLQTNGTADDWFAGADEQVREA